MGDLVLANFEAKYFDELLSMRRESFDFGVGITDPHSLAEQRDYFWAVRYEWARDDASPA